MLSTKGTYTVKETDLFSANPIVDQKSKRISQRQRESRNGYIQPVGHGQGNTNLRMTNRQGGGGGHPRPTESTR